MIPTCYPLQGGATLRVLPTQKFKSSMLSVSAVLPIQRDKVWKTTLLLAVLRRGTQKYPTLASINARLDYLFGTELSIRNFYRGDSQIVGFTADFLDASFVFDKEELLDGILDVISQILYHPLLDEKGLLLERYVESEKKLQCESIRALRNNPRAYALERCLELVYADEPCSAPVTGRIEEIMTIDAAELTAHWRELISSIRFDCFFVGRGDARALQSRLNAILCAPQGEALLSPTRLHRLPPHRKEVPARVEETLPVSQGQLLLSYRTDITLTHPDYAACVLLNEILGASPISKLFMNVREKLGLCYHCASSFNGFKGTLTIRCGLEPRSREAAEAEILAQLEAIQRGEISEEELSAAKKSLENVYRQLTDSPSAMESFYYGRALLGLDATIDGTRSRFAHVTTEQIVAAARGLRLDTVYFLRGTLPSEETEEYDEED